MAERMKISRRHFMVSTAAGTASLVLAACGSAPEPAAPQAAATTAPTVAPTEIVAPTVAPTTAATTAETAAATAEATTAAAGQGRWTTTIIAPPKKYDPPLTISQNFQLNESIKFINDETIEDNVMSRFFQEQMGVYYEPKWAVMGEEANQQKWATALASGDLPEYMTGLGGDVLGKLYEADQLEDITDIWERTATALTKKLKEYPDGVIWQPATRNNRIYGIAQSSGAIAHSDMLLWVRQDWLDKVGLQPPATLDELHAAAVAFREAGLGSMGIAASNELVTWLGSLDPVFGAFGVMPTYWIKDSSGKLVYGSVQPAMKDALALLSRWYADGTIDPEFITTDAGKTAEAVTSGNAGMIIAPWWAISWPLADSATNDPTAKWIFVDAPAGPSGQRGRAGTPLPGPLSAFRKGTDPLKIEAVINHVNWFFERRVEAVKNNDYRTISIYSFEDYDYVWNGNEIEKGPVETWLYEGGGGGTTWYYPNTLQDEYVLIDQLRTKPDAEKNAMDRFLTQSTLEVTLAEAYNQLIKSIDQQVVNQFTGIATPAMTQFSAALEKIENEAMIAIITGQAPVDSFDQFVSTWTEQGGGTITEEVNAWYGTL